ARQGHQADRQQHHADPQPGAEQHSADDHRGDRRQAEPRAVLGGGVNQGGVHDTDSIPAAQPCPPGPPAAPPGENPRPWRTAPTVWGSMEAMGSDARTPADGTTDPAYQAG